MLAVQDVAISRHFSSTNRAQASIAASGRLFLSNLFQRLCAINAVDARFANIEPALWTRSAAQSPLHPRRLLAAITYPSNGVEVSKGPLGGVMCA